MLAARVAELGLTAKPEWVLSVGDDVAAGFASLMGSHISHCVVRGSLPDLGAQRVLPGKHFLMIEDFVDVSKPVKFHQLATSVSDPFGDDTDDALIGQASDSTGGSKNRVLKMVLTDGCRSVTAIEVIPIVDIPQQLSRLPGAKLLISGSPDVCASTLLLYPCHVKFLGGSCPELQLRYKQSLAEKIARADPLRLAPTDPETRPTESTATVADSSQSRVTEIAPSACIRPTVNGSLRPMHSGTVPPLNRANTLPVFGVKNEMPGSTLQRHMSSTATTSYRSYALQDGQPRSNPFPIGDKTTPTCEPTFDQILTRTDGAVFGNNHGIPSGSSSGAAICSLETSGTTTQASEMDRARPVHSYVRTPPKKRPQSGPSVAPTSPTRFSSGAVRKRARRAEGSVVSVTQSMHEGVQPILEITPQSAITLSSCGEEPVPTQAQDDDDMTGLRYETVHTSATEDGDTSFVSASVTAVCGTQIVLDSGTNTITAEVAEGDPPNVGYHGMFLVWRDSADGVFASVLPEGSADFCGSAPID